MTLQTADEFIIEPELPIVDAHHHLWFFPETILAEMDIQRSLSARALSPLFRSRPRYLFDELMADFQSGHNVRASIHVDAETMYRKSGPQSLQSLGEVEFINGTAAMGASGLFGDIEVCAGIVGGVDLGQGEAVEEVLTAHIRTANDRYRGVRSPIAYDEDSDILGEGVGEPHMLLHPSFRRGFKCLSHFGLSFDAWLFEPQLPELIDLARAFPETPIILNHVGTPLGIGRYAGLRQARFQLWRENISALSRCENVTVKLGGLGTPFGGFDSYRATPRASSEQLADEWKPYIESCIEAFGADRCMFESNFPIDSAVCTYPVLWNAFKLIAQGASKDEKDALFHGTAIRVYRLGIEN